MQVPDLLTPKEVAEILKISYETVLSIIKSGDLKAVKIGKCYRINSLDLMAYLSELSNS